MDRRIASCWYDIDSMIIRARFYIFSSNLILIRNLFLTNRRCICLSIHETLSCIDTCWGCRNIKYASWDCLCLDDFSCRTSKHYRICCWFAKSRIEDAKDIIIRLTGIINYTTPLNCARSYSKILANRCDFWFFTCSITTSIWTGCAGIFCKAFTITRNLIDSIASTVVV